MRSLSIIGLLSIAALACAILALSVGSLSLSPEQIWGALSGREDQVAHAVVMELRLPRAAAAFAVGGLLALAGALMQVLLANPLAEPYVLGISGGAAAGALLTMLLGASAILVSGGALTGALVTMALVFGLSHGRGSWMPSRLLLTGIVIAAGWGALISFILAIAPDRNIRGMMFWLMGDLSQAQMPWIGLATLGISTVAALVPARSLNLLARGEHQAMALGVGVGGLRLYIYVTASLMTAAAVSIGGNIGFVGLLVPHMLRLLFGSDHRLLLPASVLLGGTVLLLADTLARTLFAPQQLPVGILTALVGVPVFLALLQRGQH